jgi:hypothetical protein
MARYFACERLGESYYMDRVIAINLGAMLHHRAVSRHDRRGQRNDSTFGNSIGHFAQPLPGRHR